MTLACLNIVNFRNLCSAEYAYLIPGFNCIYGKNGSGKTSLLEAIYYLSRGRSFRTSILSHLIHEQANSFVISSQSHSFCSTQSYLLGVERGRKNNISRRINNEQVHSSAEIASLLPVLLINSTCHELLEGGPQYRRQYLDWGLFYHSEHFYSLWRQFTRALKQRNRILQQRGSHIEIEAWSTELIHYANQIAELRSRYTQNLLPFLQIALAQLLPLFSSIELSYYSGWDDSLSYAEQLHHSLTQDHYLGYTQYGPHRADLRIYINGLLAKEWLSRGQQKLFVCAMIIAQGALLITYQKRMPIYLLDDLPSELDRYSQHALMEHLTQQNAQIFLTSIEEDQAKLLKQYTKNPFEMFHVKHETIETKRSVQSEIASYTE